MEFEAVEKNHLCLFVVQVGVRGIECFEEGVRGMLIEERVRESLGSVVHVTQSGDIT